ncbi:MAG TPA: cytochrome c [Pyrinomonadaceae bacterium]|jgi:mono/diheme cytochrome c family protein
MSNRKKQWAVGGWQLAGRFTTRQAFYCLLLTAHCLLFTGCRMDMQDQPKYEAYEKGSIRKPVEGTVPRGFLKDDKQLYTGKKDVTGKATAAATGALQNQSVAQQQGTGNANLSAAALYPDVVDTFPFPVTEEIVRRGEERYNIFCAMCHGPTGYGDGMIVRRGYRRPPSYHTDQLRQAPVGHFFDVMTNGWGAMPSYAAQIPVTDRWAIVAYIRALQLSQNPQATISNTTAAAAAQPQAMQTPRAETGGRR